MGHSIDASSLQNGMAWLVPFSVLVSSLIGSLHCVSMCGPLALSFAGERKRLWGYQLGRLISYTSVGAIAGNFGNEVLKQTRLPWLSELSLAFIALTLIYMGIRTLRGQGFHLRFPSPLSQLSHRLWAQLPKANLPAWATSGLAGALTVFLPCGHLYGFFVGAMATGSALSGAIFMIAFWLGTVPALGWGARWVRQLLAPGLQKIPRLAGVLLIAAGLLSVGAFAARISHTPSDPILVPDGSDQQPDSANARCH